VFYKAKIAKKNNAKNFYFHTAIDNALKNNQVKAVNLMLDYIVKYQNNFVSSFLFRFNLGEILEKGIRITALLHSNVFRVVFDFDDWPSNHPNDEYMIKPYNESYFHIR